MKKINSLGIMLSMVFVVACLHTSASGQSADSMTSSGSSVRWEVAGPYSSLTMTVSAPDGRVFRKEFKGGATLEFTAVDQKGERLPDGQYAYELRLTPVFSPGVTEELASVRAREYAPEQPRDMSKRGATSESLVQKEDSADTLREMRKRGLLPAEPQVKSGGFSILNGAIVVAGAVEGGARPQPQEEPRPTKKNVEVSRFPSVPPGGALGKVRQHHMLLNAVPDFVIADDLIVQGSACAGLDCVNGEAFNFDTIRTKENNTRIGFMDTSTGTFPTNDWTIRANSSANGGGSFLAFVDQGATSTGAETGTIVLEVDAGAPANSLRVASTGRIGNRTATPVLDIHTNTSNTPSIRLEQNSGQGFTAQTWDMGGNEANFFVRDVTSGSLLPFRIRPGAPTSSIDISADGDVGIGTASPDGKMHLFEAGTTDDVFEFFENGTRQWSIGINGGNDFFRITDQTAGVARLTILNTGFVGIGTNAPAHLLTVNGEASKPTGGSWLVFSDERLKNIKGNFNSGLKAVMQLQPLRYEYKRDNALGLQSSGEQIGFGAQDLEKVIPEAVTRTSAGYLQVNNDPIIWTMLNAIKEQQKEIEELKTEVRKLRATSRKRR